MARSAVEYACQNCGAVYGKWAGKCDHCHEWNTIEEITAHAPVPGLSGAATRRQPPSRRAVLTPLSGIEAPPPRAESGLRELDRALGGGLVAGSVILVGGDPGIGKSTLLLQGAAAFAARGSHAIYVTGEEAISQVKLRAARLGLSEAPAQLAAETNMRAILAMLEAERPALAILDSIQTLWLDGVESAPGSVTQLRACVHEAVRFAKKSGTALILVGHVTKEGQIAGPRVVEHMVDTVLYFEGERGHQFRILRAVKNRFGPVDEIGVFEMTGTGLQEVANPSALFLAEREEEMSGAAVFAGMEGTRPVLVEIQALIAQSSFGTPRRAVVGWDSGRLAMVLAVLEARCGLSLAARDVYLNVAGGLKIGEPAADLAVASALLSACEETALPAGTVIFGEIGLSGATRPATHSELRLKEAAKLGFRSAIIPSGSRSGDDLELCKIRQLPDLVALIRELSQR